MGKKRIEHKARLAFRSLVYGAFVLCLLFTLALFTGFEKLGGVFSFTGFFAAAFIVYTTIAE